MSRLVGKPTKWFSNRSDTNRPVQAEAAHIFHFRTKETCCQCEKTMDEEAPIILPCKHMVCEHCLIDLMEENSECPTCKREIPADFDRTKTKGKMRYVF